MTSPLLPIHIDSTMISCFRSCPQKFYNEFVLGLRPASLSIDLHAGACFASAIEDVGKNVHIHHLDLPTALLRAHGRFLDNWGDFTSMKDTPKTRENVWEAVEDYFRVYSPLTDHVQPYFVEGKPTFEFTFAIPLEPAVHPQEVYAITMKTRGARFPRHPSGDPFIYCGKFDLLGSWHGKPVVRDEKTTKSISFNWAEQWDLRSQFIGYTWACQQEGIPVDTAVIRGVGILKTKIHQVEATKTYSDVMRARWLEQLRRDLWRIRRAWDEGYWDFNLAEACVAYGGCPFRDLCASPEPSRWHSNFKVERWNPLLKQPIDPSFGKEKEVV